MYRHFQVFTMSMVDAAAQNQGISGQLALCKLSPGFGTFYSGR
jgi:hypothetical protein